MTNCVDTAGLSSHVSFPPMDSEDNWQQECDVKWILETVICIILCVERQKNTEGEICYAFTDGFCDFMCAYC